MAKTVKKRVSAHAHKPNYQSILITVLNTALEPYSVKDKITYILEYLLSLEHLNLGKRAALIDLGEDRENLELKISITTDDEPKFVCNEARVDQCHCGKTFASCRTEFYESFPPLYDIVQNPKPFTGNYCIPVLRSGSVLAVLAIYVNENHRRSSGVIKLFEAVASIIAVIIENQQMDQQLIQLVNDLRNSVVSLREEKKFSESIIQSLNHGLIVANLDGRIRKSNSVAKEILSSVTSEVEGSCLTDIINKEAAKELLTTVKNETGQFDKELSFTTPKGEQKIIGYSSVPREDANGQKNGIIISLSDISELKHVHKEMEKMNRLATIAEIASAVAHEVRNPLAGIKIMAQSIEEESKDSSEQLECSQRIIRQVDRLNQLLSDFFSYARPAEPNKRATSLIDIITETKPLIKNRLTKHQISLTEKISKNLPKIVADPHQVQQVFLNLFLNAFDAMQKGGKITIQAESLTKKQFEHYKKEYPFLSKEFTYVIIHFTDNGTGMPPEVAEQVFEPFFTTKTSGAGLGLSIVYRTLKENDAGIVLNSTEKQGTTFSIFFRAEK